MALLRTLPLLVVALALATGACSRNRAPEPSNTPESDGIMLRYQSPGAPLRQQLEFQFTHTRLGLYVEAGLSAQAELSLTSEGESLRASWSMLDVSSFELDGTVEPGDSDRIRAVLTELGKGVSISDAQGLLDLTATDAEPTNAARMDALATPGDAALPAAGGLLMRALAEQLRLPRLPATALVSGEPVEVEEESETVLADTDLVLPTTTVHRFTLRKIETIEGVRVAEVEIAIASVAQLEELPVTEEVEEVEPKKNKNKKRKKNKKQEAEDTEDEPEGPAAELQSRTDGTLMFDLDHGLPVSLELSHTESFRLGDQEVEQSFQLRSTFSAS